MADSKTTRERILNTGIALASRGGLEGVTLGTLADQVGMSKSGLFAHFNSKEAVQISLLEHTGSLSALRVIEPAMKEPEGLPRLRALVAHWFGWAQKAGLPGGCPVAAGMFEYDDVEGPVREKVKEMEASWRGLLATLVTESVKQGHLRRDLDVDQFVWELCGIYLSHHVAQRFQRSADADTRAQTAFAALMSRGKGPPATGKHSRSRSRRAR